MIVLCLKSEGTLDVHKSDQKAMKGKEGSVPECRVPFPVYTTIELSPFTKLVYRH